MDSKLVLDIYESQEKVIRNNNNMIDIMKEFENDIDDNVNKQNELEKEFNKLIINAGNSNAEIVKARKDFIDLDGRLDYQDSQLDAIENQLPYLDVVSLGVKNDGSDITQSLQNVISSNNKTTLFFRKGIYCVTNKITITNDVSLLFESGAELYTDTVIDSIIEYNCSYSATTNRTMKNLTLNGNNKCNTPLNIIGASSLHIDDITILNPVVAGIDVNSKGISVGSSHEVYINNAKIVNSLDLSTTYNAIGLSVNTADCNFTNIVTVNMKIGVKVTHGANVFTRVHPWINNINIFNNSIGIRNEAVGNTFKDCYMDTVFNGFSSKSNAVIDCFNFRIANSMVSNLTSSPIFVFSENNAEIIAKDCYFEHAINSSYKPYVQNVNKIKISNPRISNPNYFEGTFHSYIDNYIKTFRCNFTNIGVNPKSYTSKEITVTGLKYNDVFTHSVIGKYLDDGLIMNVYLKDNIVSIRIYNTTDTYINVTSLPLYVTVFRKNENELMDYSTFS